MMKLRSVVPFVATLAVSACVGVPPARPTPQLSTTAPLSETLAGNAADAAWPAANWWKKYGDDALDKLMEQALADAPSMATAEARFASARESVRVSAATGGLHVGAEASIARQRLSDNALFPTELLGFSWYSQADLGLRASYNFDWWHKRRDATYAALNEARAAQAERSAASLTLSSAVADAYFGWQSDQAQLAFVREQQALAQRRKHIVQARINAQIESADLMYSQDAELANLHETALGLQYSAQLRRVLLGALLGIEPDTLPAFTAKPLPEVDAHLPGNARIDLLSRRADIQASRWQVEAAEQHVGVARAEFMPDISIGALAGLSSIELGKLFDSGSRVPAVNAAIHLPIFDSGLLRAQYGARVAQLEATVANYNNTVVNAAREVATQAVTLEQLSAQRAARQAQVAAAEQQLSAATRRSEQGLSDARPALQAATTLQQQQAALTSLHAAALSAEIKLIAALGGGYGAPVDQRNAATSQP